VIKLSTNADQFARELQEEIKAAGEDKVVEMKRRVARHIRNGAEARSTVGTKRRKGAMPLKDSWSVAVGEPDLRTGQKGSDADAVAVLQNLQLNEAVFVQSSDFTSGFFEFGTRKMPPRPLAQPAIEETRSFVE
jgi:hypothetical protein